MKPMECPYRCGQPIVKEILFHHLENCSEIKKGKICPYTIIGCGFEVSKFFPLSMLNVSLYMATRLLSVPFIDLRYLSFCPLKNLDDKLALSCFDVCLLLLRCTRVGLI